MTRCFIQKAPNSDVGGKASHNEGSRTVGKWNTSTGWSNSHPHHVDLPVLSMKSSSIMLDTPPVFVSGPITALNIREFTALLVCTNSQMDTYKQKKSPWAEGGSHTASPIVSLKPRLYFIGVKVSTLILKPNILLKWTSLTQPIRLLFFQRHCLEKKQTGWLALLIQCCLISESHCLRGHLQQLPLQLIK